MFPKARRVTLLRPTPSAGLRHTQPSFIDMQTRLRQHWSSPYRSFSAFMASARAPKEAAILATCNNSSEANEEKKVEEEQLSFLKRNPHLRSVSRGGRVYGGVKCPEEITADDLEDYMKRSDSPMLPKKIY